MIDMGSIYTYLSNCLKNPFFYFFSFSFSEVRFVDGDQLLASGLPVTPAEFELLVKQQCAKTREFLKRT